MEILITTLQESNDYLSKNMSSELTGSDHAEINLLFRNLEKEYQNTLEFFESSHIFLNDCEWMGNRVNPPNRSNEINMHKYSSFRFEDKIRISDNLYKVYNKESKEFVYIKEVQLSHFDFWTRLEKSVEERWIPLEIDLMYSVRNLDRSVVRLDFYMISQEKDLAYLQLGLPEKFENLEFYSRMGNADTKKIFCKIVAACYTLLQNKILLLDLSLDNMIVHLDKNNKMIDIKFFNFASAVRYTEEDYYEKFLGDRKFMPIEYTQNKLYKGTVKLQNLNLVS